MTERERAGVLRQVVDGVRTRASAAQTIGIGERQLRRLLRRFEAAGATGLLSRRGGRPPTNRVDDVVRSLILGRCKDDYAGFGPTSLAQILAEREGIVVSREFVRTFLVANGLWSAQRRERKRRADRAIVVGACELVAPLQCRAPDPKKVRIPAQNHPWKAPFKTQPPGQPDSSPPR